MRAAFVPRGTNEKCGAISGCVLILNLDTICDERRKIELNLITNSKKGALVRSKIVIFPLRFDVLPISKQAGYFYGYAAIID